MNADLIQRLSLMPREHLERVLEWAVRNHDVSENTSMSMSYMAGWEAFSETLIDLLEGKENVLDHLPRKEETT